MAETNEILRVEHLKKYFDTPAGTLHAVDDITFSLDRGRTLGVVGESGCGKSTMGRAILRLHEPTSGKVWFEGQDILSYDKKRLKALRKDMQIIFQDPFASLNPRMTVAEAIAAPLVVQNVYSRRDKKGLRKKVAEFMDLVGLAPRLVNTYPHELDGGRRQRIGIGRALAMDPEFIICDEPVSALDVSIQAQILNLLMDLQDEKKLTYVFITHDLSVVKHISHEIMVMYLGQCVEYAETEDLFKNPLHPYTKGLLDAVPIPSLKAKKLSTEVMRGELTSPVDPAPGCRFAARCPYATDACRGRDIPLKEVEPGHFVSCTRF